MKRIPDGLDLNQCAEKVAKAIKGWGNGAFDDAVWFFSKNSFEAYLDQIKDTY